MKTRLSLSVILLAVFAFISCENQLGDTTKPQIDLIAPADGDTLFAGDHIHFSMEVSDDVALGSYKVEIHNNFDGHTHDHVSPMHDHEEEPFAFNRVWSDIADKRNAHVHHHEIEIPSDVALGDYHFIVYCSDKAGNETQVVSNVILSVAE